MNLFEALDTAPENNQVITDSLVLMHAHLKNYSKIMCSVSGGSDSDILIDLCQKFDEATKITYAYFDTGLEFEATKNHLIDLEDKYEIDIIHIKPDKSIPFCCREYGQPFLSKQVSEWIERLQRHNFQWEDKSFEELYEKYPKCKAALRWWCNDFARRETGRESSFNICYHQFLKEFMIANPPTFKISNKCCYYAKKKPAQQFKLQNKFDLNIYGVRKAEGGARQTAYKTCFSSRDDCDEFRPIFWYLQDTKQIYEETYHIEHSDCYNIYGLQRSGCAGCPFGRDYEKELEAIQLYEPKLYQAAKQIFNESYEYTKAYREFVMERKNG